MSRQGREVIRAMSVSDLYQESEVGEEVLDEDCLAICLLTIEC
jgi:hypothetical protein